MNQHDRSGTAIPFPRTKLPPPREESELLARARAMAGRNVGELADEAGVPVPSESRRAKGLVGRLVEWTLGADAGSASQPDFRSLGIELKTIPLDLRGKPRESTFVCTVELGSIADIEWEQSRVYRKLSRVLWVPVQSDPSIALPQRRLGTALLWSPSAEQQAALRQDWEQLAGIMGCGDVESITADLGRCLQIRPKAASARSLGRARDADGVGFDTLPRGFYLRASFTETIFRGRFAT
jgi:DNA mismatch repair protein MutH